MRTISRKEAKAKGLKRYFTGKPCKHGHVAERRCVKCDCVECIKIGDRKRYSEDPSRKKKNAKIWYSANTERAKLNVLDWGSKNTDLLRAYSKKHYRANTHKWRVYREKYRASLLGCKEHHTVSEVANLLEKQKHKCANCRACLKSGYHVDHIVPLSKGGENGISNIQCLCPFCNQSKGALDPVEWAQREGRLI